IETQTVPQQGCCGALHLHTGDEEEAKRLARQNIAAFEARPEEEWIVNTAGGCGAMLMEYGRLLADDPIWAQRAERFSRRIRDWSTALKEKGKALVYQGSGERVTLQNSCHLVNVEKAGDDPVTLIRQVQGDEFVPIAGQNSCCGSAGVYNLTHTDMSLQVLDRKMQEVDQAAPDRILVNNPGCHLQMQWGVSRLSPAGGPEVEHVARYLYRAAVRAQSLAPESNPSEIKS
ncbi:MAG: heterodisulfide reductase-related iron-sulfur binding cluster, partial [Firmicutes bacterium]|nr:heterodisulfide reductase-related iron-sulfur binding cluster [Bacillota bacterium]